MVETNLYDILQRILLLEEGQVVLYSTLASEAPNEELTQGLKRLATIEGDHVKNIQTKITTLFPEKNNAFTTLKDNVTDMGLKLFGSTVSITQGVTGLATLMQAGAAAEKKAMADYRKILAQIQEPELRDMLWEHLIDEELHFLWLEKHIEEVKSPQQ